jgi:AcrR family transcriptional regulator
MTGTRDAGRRALRGAGRLLYEQGVAATGVDALAAAAGVGKMSLYRHFGSKDELVGAALRERDRRHLAWLLPFDGGRDPVARLLGMFDRVAAVADGGGFRGCPFVAAASELPDPDHPGRVAAREHKERLIASLTSPAAEAGAADPGRLAEELALLLDGATVHAVVRGGGDPVRAARRLAALAIDHAVRGGRDDGA